MQRVNPTVLAAIALGILILLIVGMMVFAGRSEEDDRLTGNEVASRSEDPESLCGSQRTNDLIKRELFQRAAAARGADEAAFAKVARYSSLRLEAPALRDEDGSTDAVTCSGTLTLDLPPGVAAAGGRRSLTADVLYTVQKAPDESGDMVTLSNAEEIITPLSELAKTDTPAEASTDMPANQIAPVPADPLAPIPAPPSPSASPESAAAVTPSFNCASARTSGEVAVCNDDRLAVLDRRMATQFGGALKDADPAQRTQLIRTRDAFLTYRDRCTSNECIAETYRGRMREIRDIMLGRWQPQR
ncbi:MAG: hypothetical protein HOP96_12375 [Sphingomonas sp.]|nr:hypothetical protein [Sphingomonas sp.]